VKTPCASWFRRHRHFLAILSVAALLRLHGLAAKGLWLDEAYSAHLAHCGWAALLRGLSRESTPPFYYLVLHCWVRLFGEGEAALRLPSVLFSLGGVCALYALARKHFSSRSALIAAALIAFSLLHVYYAQEARMYSLLAFLGTIFVDAAMGYAQERQVRALAAAGVSATLMLYTHTVALWLVAGCGLAVFAVARENKARLGWLAMLTATGLAYSPWTFILAKQVSRQQTVLEWLGPLWRSKSIAGHVADSLAGMCFGPFPNYVAIQGSAPSGVMALLAMTALAVCGFLRARASGAARLACVTFLVALGLGIGYSGLAQPVFIPGRTDSYLLPLFLVFVAHGIAGLAWRPARAMSVAGCGLLSALTLFPYYRDTEKDASRAYMASWRGTLHAGDAVIATGHTYAVCEYYMRRWQVPATLLSYPLSAQEHPGYLNSVEEMRRPQRLDKDAQDIARLLAARLGARGEAVVLFSSPYAMNSRLLKQLNSALAPVPAAREPYHEALIGAPVQVLRYRRYSLRPSAGNRRRRK